MITIKQDFTIPPNIIYYICKRSTPSHIVLLKLYNSCKYFWPKMKVMPVSNTFLQRRYNGEFRFYVENKKTCFETLNAINIKLLFCDDLLIGDGIGQFDKHYLSSLISKWRFDLTSCRITDQILTLNEFKILTKDVAKLSVSSCKILKSESNVQKELSLNEIIVIPQKLVSFSFRSKYSESSAEILFQNLCNLSLKTKLRRLVLTRIPNALDPLLFAKFIKENFNFDVESVEFYLSWKNTDEEYQKNFITLFENELKIWFNGTYINKFDCVAWYILNK